MQSFRVNKKLSGKVCLPAALGVAVAMSGAMGGGVAHAQVLGELKGRVTDASGAALPGAKVTLTRAGTKVSLPVATTSAGEYDYTQLTSGVYNLTIEQAGFTRLDRQGVTVTTGETVLLDLSLKAGSADQVVTVVGDAPLLQAGTSDIATTIPGREVIALPLNSRNFIQLTQLAPGVSLPPGTVLPRINGGRPRTNEYLYDGISALQPEPGQVAFFPIIDGIAEFTVEANNVPAEFGRFNGGVVNVATRSGTNDLHGSLFEFFRNEYLNSRNYFATAGTRKPEYRRNLFGATLGAPIRKDKLFVFADYQGILQRIGVTRTSTVPTLAQRAGNFGTTAIYNPTRTTIVNGVVTRPQFLNNVINVPFDSAAQAVLAYIPLPTSTASANNYVRTAPDDDHQNQFDVRLDAALGSHDRGFARYTYYHEVEQPSTPFPNGSGAITGSVVGTGNVTSLANILGQQVVINETHTFSSSLLNDFRIGYTRRGNAQLGEQLASSPSTALGIPGIPTNAAFNNTLPLFTFTGLQQVGSGTGTSLHYQTAVGELIDTVVFTRGAHNLKAGVDSRRYELNAIAPPNPTGSFAFTTTGTDTVNAAGASTGGNAFASFLLGQVDTFQIDLQQRTIRPRDYIHEIFVQDDWRATPRLTINAGLRWSLALASTETHNQGAIFNLATQQLDYLGVNGFSRTARRLHYGNVAPRFGFAFAADPKTVIRSGFGIVFIDQSGITTPFTTPQYPFIQSIQSRTTDSLQSPFALSSGPTIAPVALTPAAGLGQSVYTANHNAGSGYVEQWNLAVQRALSTNLSFEIAYVGSHVVHVGIPDQNLNQLSDAQIASGLGGAAAAKALTGTVANPYYGKIPTTSQLGALPTIGAGQLLKPYPQFQNVAFYRNNTGTQNYNAIEGKMEARVARGLTAIFAYTHSRLLDDASSVFSSTVLSSPTNASLTGADTYRPYLERDASTGDTPNVSTAGVVYTLPAFKGHGFLTPILGGWSANGILNVQSGAPVVITQGTNTNAFAGVATARPNLVADPRIPGNQRNAAHWFNNYSATVATSYQGGINGSATPAAAFATAPQFTFGNASRNPVRGPAYRDLDLALVKYTNLSEKTTLEFRAELFDALNTPGLGQPNGAQGTAAFGTITTTTTDPRVAQFALRLRR